MGADGTPGVAVRDLVRAVVAEVAPAELPVVDALRQFDDATVVARLKGGGSGREPLGFGLEDAVYLATPVLWVALDETVRKVVDGVPRGVRRIFGRKRAAPVVVPELTRQQVADVRQRVLELAAQSGLTPERAEALADRLAVRLLLPETADEQSGPASRSVVPETAEEGDERRPPGGDGERAAPAE